MIYKLVKMEFEEHPDRFNRQLLVREDVNLVELGCIMCTALKTQFEHNFLFIKNKRHFEPDCFLDDAWPNEFYKEVPMKDYALEDLGRKFQFLYDTGEDWLFNCEVKKEPVELDSTELAHLVDGTGQGIWEDNAGTLRAYLDGEIDPNTSEEDLEEYYYFPWNFKNKKISDFDTKYNQSQEAHTFQLNMYSDIERYLLGCYSNGYELEVDIRTNKIDDGEAKSHYINNFDSQLRKMTDGQIANFEFVKKKYNQLVEKYDREKARDLIFKALKDEITESRLDERPFYIDEYEKRIKKIK